MATQWPTCGVIRVSSHGARWLVRSACDGPATYYVGHSRRYGAEFSTDIIKARRFADNRKAHDVARGIKGAIVTLAR